MASHSLWFENPQSEPKSDLLLCTREEGEGKGVDGTGQAWAGEQAK